MSKLFKKIFSVHNAKNGFGKDITVFGLSFNINTSKFYKPIIKKTKIINNKIVFSNFSNKGYGCNPKYIAEEILRQKLPYELFWIVKNPKKERKNFPKEIKLVKSGTLSEIKEHASAKIWISNARKNSLITKGLFKKEGQIYIQTWHGSLGIKKAERAAENLPEQYITMAKQDSQITNFYVSNSLFEDEVFSKNFWYNGDILKLGHARNDIFFLSDKERDNILTKICSSYGINPNSKLILYVPTFRDKNNKYDINLNKIISELNNDNNSYYTVLTRLHPNIAKISKNTFKYSKNIIDVTNYSDIQELLLVADILITDYSSCIFDYMLSKKPAFIFAPDLDDYNTERGFLYSLNSTPFPISTTTDELIKNIKTLDYENYKIKVDEFLKEKGCIDDGHSSERFVEFIKDTLSEDK